MDGHQFRGARIHRDMMLVSRCVVGLSVVSGGERSRAPLRSGSGKTRQNRDALLPDDQRLNTVSVK